MKSANGEFNATDFVKTIGVFVWNASSVALAVLLAILALPADQVPDWLAWLIPLSGLINAVAFGLKTWRADNRGY